MITQAIEKVVDGIQVFFLSSVDRDGFPNTKAMLAPRKREGIRTFYFTTALSSQKAVQFRENPKANLYFCNPQTFDGILLLGTMEVLTDPQLKEEMWREGDTLYHPLGITDPDYCVLRFTAERGRYYRNLSSENFAV